MKKIFVFLGLLLISSPAMAAPATHANDVVTYRSGISPDIPTCGTNQVLTYNGQLYACVSNFTPASCPPNQGISKIYSDGHVDCGAALYPPGLACNGTDMIGSINGGSVTCIPQIPAPPNCGLGQVLSYTKATGLKCIYATQGFIVNIADMQTPFCNQNVVMRTYGTGKSIFSAGCISACHHYCIDKAVAPDGGRFNGGTLTDWNAMSLQANCACSK